MKKLTYILVLCIYPLLNAFAQEKIVIDEVIAVVATQPVYYSDFQDQLSQYKAQGNEITKELESTILENILMQKLLVYKAKEDSIVVTDDEIDMQVNNRLKYFLDQVGGDETKLEDYFKKSIKEIKEEMRKPLKDQLLSQRARWAVVDGIKLTPGDVKDFYASIPTDSLPKIGDQIQVAQILKFPTPSSEAIQNTIDKLNEYKKRIANGEDFETLALIYSTDPGSASNGGLYKGIKKGMFVKEFEDVMYSLEIGQISEPFKTEYGYHIVKLEAREGEVVDVRHILLSPNIDANQLNEAKLVLDSLKTHITNGKYSFEEAALKYSDDKQTKNNGGLIINPTTGSTFFELAHLDKLMQQAIVGLDIDQTSVPIFVQLPNNKNAYRIVHIKSKKASHTLNLTDDYQTVQHMAKLSREDEKFNTWLEKKVGKIYFSLKDEYKSLPFKFNWVK
jgi:peptidyl-prolyl cis-trans isomerase SurA